MSFYGNVFYELTNAFASFKIYKDLKDKDGTLLEALGTGGSFTFAPGNKWITLEANPTDYKCSIAHSELHEENVNVMPFDKVDAAAGTSTELKAGDTIAVPAFQYDMAGHIINTNTLKYFTLPMSETETNIEDLQNRMETLEGAETNQNTRLTTLEDTFDSHTNSIKDLDTRTAALEELSPRVEELEKTSDNLENLVGGRDSMTAEDLTITGVIGNFDKVSKDLEYRSISEGLTVLTQSVNATNSSVSNQALAVRVAIKNLCDILNQAGIEVDYDSLWEV